MSENENDIAERIGNEREAEMKKQREQNKKIYLRKHILERIGNEREAEMRQQQEENKKISMRKHLRECKPEIKSDKINFFLVYLQNKKTTTPTRFKLKN